MTPSKNEHPTPEHIELQLPESNGDWARQSELGNIVETQQAQIRQQQIVESNNEG